MSYRNKLWRFLGVYGHPDSTQCSHTWILLNRLQGLSALPWLCGGDFNEILQEKEKSGGLPRKEALMDSFRLALDSWGLMDLGFSGPEFTWSYKRDGGDLIHERIHRCVSLMEWMG
ncbi:hypothetical protein Dsin_005190 [Dipteronia sinensis]|uniref:Endonuclease/exonuclease/phosphatase domain-containing protein n=1 Tax=Dipteronia sinensis TaxID=43782 RepID=A0AAE0AW69_9ROSI|nr:hypothetical protein Dsin_005190 [Dipteronia sinensis]